MVIEIITQVVSLFFLTFIFVFFIKSMQITSSRISEVYIWIIAFLIFLFLDFFDFSDSYSLFIIIFISYVFFYKLKGFIKISLFTTAVNLIFLKDYRLLIMYYFVLIITYFLSRKVRFFKHKLLVIYFLSLLLLNIELFHKDQLPIYNYLFNLIHAAIWLVLILFGYYYKEKTELKINMIKCKFLDDKTNVNNYYCLLQKSYRLLKSKHNDISLIIVNIDRLYDINSLYGKSCGDKVIKMVAKNIVENTKGYGEVYRLDGNSFCVVALNEKFNIMKIIVEKIKLSFEIKKSLIDNNKIKLTVSIGGYFGKTTSKNIDDYIEIAHDSMMNAKFEGRNTAIINNNMLSYYKIM